MIYLAAGTNGVFVYSITNPETPVLVGYVNTPGDALGLGVSPDRIFIADMYDLSVYRRIRPVKVVERPPDITVQNPKPLSWLENKTFIVSGTAQDGQSGVRMVEISMDSGKTWQEVFGQNTWSFVASGLEKGRYPSKHVRMTGSGNISSETTEIWCYFNPPSPEIFVAGFEKSKAAAGKPVEVIMNALVRDPWDEVYINKLDVRLDGESVDLRACWELLESSGYIYFRLVFEHVFHQGAIPEINLIVDDSFGNPSPVWPQVPMCW